MLVIYSNQRWWWLHAWTAHDRRANEETVESKKKYQIELVRSNLQRWLGKFQAQVSHVPSSDPIGRGLYLNKPKICLAAKFGTFESKFVGTRLTLHSIWKVIQSAHYEVTQANGHSSKLKHCMPTYITYTYPCICSRIWAGEKSLFKININGIVGFKLVKFDFQNV